MKSPVVLILLLCTVFALAKTQPSTDASPVPDTSKPLYLDPQAAAGLVEKKVPAAFPEKAHAAGTQGTVVLNVTVSEKGEVTDATAASGDADLAQAAIDSIKQWQYKPYIVNGKPTLFETQVAFGFHLKDPPTNRVRVSSEISGGRLIKRVEPTYPPLAKAAHIEGTVVFHAVIDKEGNVVDLKVLSGRSELVPATVDAVKRWKYRPYLLKGEPVELETTVQVSYWTDGR